MIAFMGMGIFEFVVVAVVALLVFGGRLPEVMRNLGQAYGKFRRGMDEFTNPIRDEMRRLDREVPRPTRGSMATNLPPPADEPPPSYADSLNTPLETTETPEMPADDGDPDGAAHPATEDAPDAPVKAPRTRGVADEPPPV